MKEGYWGYWLILLGVFVVVIMLLIQNVTSNSTEDYYTVKQISEAAMIDAVDYAYYREFGEIKINKEKFIESFLRRFSDTASVNGKYKVLFTGIYEAPPKVSVEITSETNTYTVADDSTSFDMSSRIDAILEQKELSGTGGGGSSSSGTTQAGGTSATCEQGITSTNLAGMHGTAMGNVGIVNAYNSSTRVGTTEPGVIFTIKGENGNKWAIDYNGTCGWVDNTKMAINLKDYFSGHTGIRIDITNASASQMKVYGNNLPNITGYDIYGDEFDSFVPLTYSFAEQLKRAADAAKNAGDRIVVNDAYRPSSVGSKVYNSFDTLINSGTIREATTDNQCRNASAGTYYNCSYDSSISAYNGLYWKRNTFIIPGGDSIHGYGCAVDVTLESASGQAYQMPSAMHELSSLAVKWAAMRGHTALNNQSTKYSEKFRNNTKANTLSNYMMNAGGMEEITSEWWHYQSSSCKNTIGQAQDFWNR